MSSVLNCCYCFITNVFSFPEDLIYHPNFYLVVFPYLANYVLMYVDLSISIFCFVLSVKEHEVISVQCGMSLFGCV